jgi:DNA polymerase elongation subunit (family B)
VVRNSFPGYHGDEDFLFYKINFTSEKAMRQARYCLEKKPMNVWTVDKQHQWFPMYEANVPVEVQFFHAHGLLPCGWHLLDEGHPSTTPVSRAERVSRCDREYKTSAASLSKVLAETGQSKIPPLVECSFDIESWTSDRDTFPTGDSLICKTITIGTTFKTYGQAEPFLRHVVTLKKSADVAGVEVESYETERELLVAWQRLMNEQSPDVIYGCVSYEQNLVVHVSYVFLNLLLRCYQVPRLASGAEQSAKGSYLDPCLRERFATAPT